MQPRSHRIQHTCGSRTVLFLTGKKQVAPYVLDVVRSLGVLLKSANPNESAKTFLAELERAAESRGLDEWSLHAVQASQKSRAAKFKFTFEGNGRKVELFFEADSVHSREGDAEYYTVSAMVFMQPRETAENLLDVPTDLALFDSIRRSLANAKEQKQVP